MKFKGNGRDRFTGVEPAPKRMIELSRDDLMKSEMPEFDRYLFEVTKAEVTKSQQGNDTLHVMFSIVGGPYGGYQLLQAYPIAVYRDKLKAVLWALGILDVGEWGGSLDPDHLVGLKASAELFMESTDKGDYLRLDEWLKAPEVESATP
ncbi:MAG: hypothetical protein QM778_00735 [Myxococcales bacterium]